MQTEVMRYYGLARPPVDLGFFEAEHHAQLTNDLKTAITGGRLFALTAIIGSGKRPVALFVDGRARSPPQDVDRARTPR